MTRKDMDRHFASPIYDDIRKFIKKVMDAHPEITDELVVEFAAGKMGECSDDGVDISVDDALRLTEKHDTIPTAEDFLEVLSGGGVETVGDLMSLIANAADGTPEPAESVPMSVVKRAARMTELGRRLSNGNKDIVLMGIPADLTWSFAQLKLAFFTENLTKEEQDIILELQNLSDSVKYAEEYGIGYAMFKIYLDK